MRLFVGIDGGGSKTECVVADEEQELGRFTAGTCKMQRVGREAATASLQAAMRGAFYAAKVPTDTVAHTCMGLAGSSQPGVVEWATQNIRKTLPGGVTITGDHIIAHEAAFHGKAGVLIIAGTGSIVYGRNEAGQTLRAGGWGPVISDEGSGEWMGKIAVNSAMLAHASGQDGALLAEILKSWELTAATDLERVSNGYPPPNFAALFPHIQDAANSGDELAASVIERGGEQLARIALIAIKRLWTVGSPVIIAGAGGVITNSPRIREVVQRCMQREWPQARLKDDVIDPTLGALYIARHAQA